MYLKAGEKLRLETLLYGLLLSSGNDAAVAIAEHVAGSVPAFVEKMNETARDIGMQSSSFANPNGLDQEGHYSTARDMALLAREAVQEETLVRITSTKSISIDGRSMQNHNKLLHYVDGCIGLKTGYTRAAGRTLVSCAERNGMRLVAVTLQDGNDWADHESLYDYGFQNFSLYRGAILGKELTHVPVSEGMCATVPLVAAQHFSWPLQEGERIETEISLPETPCAPLFEGTPVGEAIFHLNGQKLGSVKLLCGKSVLPRLQSAMGTLRLKLPE